MSVHRLKENERGDFTKSSFYMVTTWLSFTQSEEHLKRKKVLFLPCSFFPLLLFLNLFLSFSPAWWIVNIDPKSKANPNSAHLNLEPHETCLSQFNGNSAQQVKELALADEKAAQNSHLTGIQASSWLLFLFPVS